MTVTLGTVFATAQAVSGHLKRMSICWHGTPLSDRDRLTFADATAMWTVVLMDVSSPDGVRPSREYVGWAMQIARIDVGELASFLSDAVVLCRTIYKPTTYSWFKRQLSKDYPFAGVVLGPMKELVSSFVAEPSAGAFIPLYQALSFVTHLSLQDIEHSLEGGYIELEEELQSLAYDPAMISELNEIMRTWFAGFCWNPATFAPQHGPGSCFELSRRAGSLEKYWYLGTDALLDYFARKYLGVAASDYVPFTPWNYAFSRIAKIVSVPKSIKTRRIISKEPASLMWFQQACKKEIERFIHSSPHLRSHINFEQQQLNGELALGGSCDQSFSTIDLSSASDRVTWQLVKAVFRGTPLYPALLSTRSHSVLLESGKVLRIAKFAPMGSALCFPVQTLIFAALTEYTVRRTRNKWGYDASAWRVYGDDIIVEEPCYWDLIHTLRSCHFQVNTAKSYSSPYRFRESCGYEGYDGVEVTPMKISRRFYGVSGNLTSGHGTVFEGLVEMANSCHHHDLPLLRAWLIRVILDKSPSPPLFSEEGNGALYSPCPDNFRAQKRGPEYGSTFFRKPWYQLSSVQVAVVRSTPCRDGKGHLVAVDEDARYIETLRLIQDRSSDMFDPAHLVNVPKYLAEPTLVTRWVHLLS